MTLGYTFHESPVGPLLMAGRGDVLHLLSFPAGHKKRELVPAWVRDDNCLPEARRQLDEYFKGKRTGFDIPLALNGSAFQLKVWDALLAIPYGETRSYGQIAQAIGEPLSASRAVGMANGDNPVPVIVPCHRVIGADGSLTGFGGGLAIKKFLLDLEDSVRPQAGKQLALFG